MNNPHGNTRTNKKFIVVHWTAGPALAGADSVFANPAYGVSAHYGVGGTEIHQYVDENLIAWHARSWNRDSLGVEHVGGYPGPGGVLIPPSDETLRTSGRLIGRLHHEWGMGRPEWGVTLRRHNEYPDQAQ
jgi:hypothetical protein